MNFGKSSLVLSDKASLSELEKYDFSAVPGECKQQSKMIPRLHTSDYYMYCSDT